MHSPQFRETPVSGVCVVLIQPDTEFSVVQHEAKKFIAFTTAAALIASETRHTAGAMPPSPYTSMAPLEAARLNHTDPELPQQPDYLLARPILLTTSTGLFVTTGKLP